MPYLIDYYEMYGIYDWDERDDDYEEQWNDYVAYWMVELDF